MKKLSNKCLQRALRRQRIQAARSLRSRGRLRSRRLRKRVRSSVAVLPVVVSVPKHLHYYARKEVRQEVEDFFETVDDLLRRGREVSLDFTKVTLLFPCGVLILMGWIDQWARSYPSRLTGKYPKDDLVEQMLQQVMVLHQLGLPPRKQISHHDVKRWHHFRGENADATPMEPFMLQLKELLGTERQLGLGNCITEAMINVGHHAYCQASGPWWIFATITDDFVFIALHDRGESVPGTLLGKPIVSDYLKGRVWSEGRADGQLITAAVGGRTRTGLPYRGKGLPEMLDFTKNSPRGELGIYSRNGFYKYQNGIESNGRLKTPVRGTLVIWRIQVLANDD